MNTNLFFDFIVDKPNKTVYIKREFAASLDLVWDAFTKAEILDQWVAPAPFVAKTKYMNFEEGGKRFYAMVSPEGNEHWALQTFSEIHPKTVFKMFNTFADKDENPQPTGSDWQYNFNETNGITLVSISIFNESLERMEKMIEMGFKEGFTITVANLEKVLEQLSK